MKTQLPNTTGVNSCDLTYNMLDDSYLNPLQDFLNPFKGVFNHTQQQTMASKLPPENTSVQTKSKKDGTTVKPTNVKETTANTSNPTAEGIPAQDAIAGAFRRLKKGKITEEDFALVLLPYLSTHSKLIAEKLSQLDFLTQERAALALVREAPTSRLSKIDPTLSQAIKKAFEPDFPFQSSMPDLLNGMGDVRSFQIKKAEKKLSEASSLDFLLSAASGELNVHQMQLARQKIEAIKDPRLKQDHWEKLQGKAAYMNQRNVRKDFDEGTIGYGQGITGGTCGLSSLAMALSYLGIDIAAKTPADYAPKPQNDTERLFAIGKTKKNNFNIVVRDQWRTTLGPLLGFDMIELGSGKKTKAWWEQNVRDKYLRNGMAVLCSKQGYSGTHIVRIQAITEAGIVVDDPLGKSKLEANGKRDDAKEINHSTNGAQPNKSPGKKTFTQQLNHNNGGRAGSDHIWAWDKVEIHSFFWISAIVKR